MKLKLNLNLIKNKKVGLAISGGADSMALLELFIKECPSPFYVINIEHGIRKKSQKDSDFVKSFCNRFNIKFHGYHIDSLSFAEENKISIELAARKLRYQIFQREVEEKKCDLIATAHHQGDQTETILLRLFRGTGINGLQGIKEKQGYLIHPLLNFKKEDILSYLKENNIDYVNDETNFLDDYNRNYLRLNVIPKIEKRFPSFSDNISRLSKNATEEEEFISKFINKPIKIKNGIAIKEPFSTPYILKKEILLAFKELGVLQDIELKHQNLIVELTKQPNGKKLDMPYNVTVYREKDSLAFVKNLKKEDISIPFSKLIATPILLKKFGFQILDKKPKDKLYCDLDKIPKDALLRYKQNGDRFTKFGGGTKSLGDFLTDKKIPLRLRENLLVIGLKNDILLIKGIEISNKIKTDENTKNFLVF